MHKYQELINKDYQGTKRKRLSNEQRAAQFSPFAALVGHSQAIQETARLTELKIELSEDIIFELNEKLNIIQEHLPYSCTITYFIPDSYKEGGHYETITKMIMKIDYVEQCLILEDKLKISVHDIIDLQGDGLEL